MKEHNRLRMEIRCQSGKRISDSFPVNEESCTQDGTSIHLLESTHERMQTAALHLNLNDEESWMNHGLEKDHPIRVYVPLEPKPKKMTAMYLFNEWWTRPAFTSRFEEIPPLTQVLFLLYEDHCACFVPMVGKEWKACLNSGTETELCLELTAGMGGIQTVEETLYVMAEGDNLSDAVQCAFQWLAKEKNLRTRQERQLPDLFRYIGWCSWDAFYKEVNETGIRQKAAELAEKGVPVRWMMIDDGWMSSEGRYLTDYAPDSVKFPHGFRQMTEELRKSSPVKWFGVWHALGGYWSGVKPETELARQEEKHLCKTVSGALVPDLHSGSGFYQDWYEALQREGIEFVKVDGQSAAAIYYENTVPVSAAARGMNEALESGSFRMNHAVINCMGMAMENILARPTSAVSRNSDDFVPNKEGGFGEHLLQNAYNSIYHNELYCCDWDMFWTNHPDCEKHSLLRAISGGPVYFSDRVGETIPSVLRPLSYLDGELLMMNRSARPTEDCMFENPLEKGVLKLHNTGAWGNKIAGGIAVYNLTKAEQSYSFSPDEVPELEKADRYWVYDFFGKRCCSLRYDEKFYGTLNAEGYSWFVILPEQEDVTFLGLSEKYAGFTAVEWVSECSNQTTVVLKEKGSVAWMSRRECRSVECDGVDVTAQVQKNGDLYSLSMKEKSGKMILTVKW